MIYTMSQVKDQRKKNLTTEEQLERATGSGGSSAYVPGETHRNNKQYLTDDQVKDKNGNPYTSLQPNINKPPASNPKFWKPDAAEVKRWSDILVGTEILVGTKVFHNNKNWIANETHIKTAGNGPRQGSDLWRENE